jgi:hypothetical protein
MFGRPLSMPRHRPSFGVEEMRAGGIEAHGARGQRKVGCRKLVAPARMGA